MVTHSSTLAWKIPWTEEPGRLQSMGSWRVGHDWATSLSLFTFMHWRRKWQPTPVFLPGESQDGGAQWAAVCGVTQSRTQLKWLSNTHIQSGFRKGRTADQIANFAVLQRKQGIFRKTSISVSWVMLKLLTRCIMTNCRNLLERWEYQTILPVSWETCMQVKRQQLEPWLVQDWERRTIGLSA